MLMISGSFSLMMDSNLLINSLCFPSSKLAVDYIIWPPYLDLRDCASFSKLSTFFFRDSYPRMQLSLHLFI